MERKVKYDYTYKKECVELVLNNNHSSRYVSKLKGPDESNIRKWVSFYKTYGESGLFSGKNRKYPLDFKLKVLQSIYKDSLSLKEATLRFNISDSSVIIKWQKDFSNFGLKGLYPKTRGKPKFMSNNKAKRHQSNKLLTKEEELFLENEALRCELDYLKKLQALIQAEEKAKKRKS
ncbi:MAG: transposase [Flavobacterium sp.]